MENSQKLHLLGKPKTLQGHESHGKGVQAPLDTICKTIHQYSKGPVSDENMEKLSEIAKDCCIVKNYVYTRYGGIGSLGKLYPGYTVQNEMTESGLRQRLNLPSVYFYLAVFDALGDIKKQWSRTKARILELLNKNERLSADEKHYLRFILKVSNAFEAVVSQRPVILRRDIQKSYDELAARVDTEKLHRYLCRQVRKYHTKQHTDMACGFRLSEKAYRYEDHGIYIAIKEKRKRIFLPLTDNNRYRRQIYLKLLPESNRIEIKVPVEVAVKSHEDYTGQTGVAMGIHTMLTTDNGHLYGEELGRMQTEYTDWIRLQTGIYNQNRESNPGRKKYYAAKRRRLEQLHSYINHELNRFLETEKPQTVYIVRLPAPGKGGKNPRINHTITLWQRGYIKKRLEQKCQEQSIQLIEVLGKDISNECSRCGAIGTRTEGDFLCPKCGYKAKEKINTAQNVKKRGQGEGILKRS